MRTTISVLIIGLCFLGCDKNGTQTTTTTTTTSSNSTTPGGEVGNFGTSTPGAPAALPGVTSTPDGGLGMGSSVGAGPGNLNTTPGAPSTAGSESSPGATNGSTSPQPTYGATTQPNNGIRPDTTRIGGATMPGDSSRTRASAR